MEWKHYFLTMEIYLPNSILLPLLERLMQRGYPTCVVAFETAVKEWIPTFR